MLHILLGRLITFHPPDNNDYMNYNDALSHDLGGNFQRSITIHPVLSTHQPLPPFTIRALQFQEQTIVWLRDRLITPTQHSNEPSLSVGRVPALQTPLSPTCKPKVKFRSLAV